MKEIKFYKSQSGKILIGLVDNESNDGLKELKAGEVDAALEKHVPIVKHENGKLVVDVGSLEHPMLDVHYIQFIVLQSERGLEVVELRPNEKPHAEFGDIEHGVVYEYCNLHGLWKQTF